MENNNKVYVRRTFECSTETLYDWLVSPELIAQWFGPEGYHTKVLECHAVPQGNYRFSLFRGEQYRFTIFGTYLEMERPNFLKFSYQYEDLPSKPSSVVSFRLIEKHQSTRLEMVQEFKVQVPDFSTRSKAWIFMLNRLSKLVQ